MSLASRTQSVSLSLRSQSRLLDFLSPSAPKSLTSLCPCSGAPSLIVVDCSFSDLLDVVSSGLKLLAFEQSASQALGLSAQPAPLGLKLLSTFAKSSPSLSPSRLLFYSSSPSSATASPASATIVDDISWWFLPSLPLASNYHSTMTHGGSARHLPPPPLVFSFLHDCDDIGSLISFSSIYKFAHMLFLDL